MQQNSISDKVYTIGRSSDNSFELPFPSISVHHANLICLSENTFIIEDKGSTNGTFINDMRVRRAVCNRNDWLCLGDRRFDLNRYFPSEQVKEMIQQQMGIQKNMQETALSKNDPNDFTGEFAELELVYKLYNDRKLIIHKAQQHKRMIQMIPGALLSVALTCFGMPGFAVAAGSIGGIVGITLSNTASEQEKAAAIEDEFKINYCCPRCKSFFGYVPWISIANKKLCERCKAILIK